MKGNQSEMSGKDIDDRNNSVNETSIQEEETALNESLQADPRLISILQCDRMTESTLEQFRFLIGPFQEQGQLLDPILRDMVTPLIQHIRLIIQESNREKSNGAFPFQILQDDKRIQLHYACQALYLICKVRGYKTLVKFLPHEVAEFEPVFHLLQSQDRDDHTTWEIRYVLLLWLSILTLVPFDLVTIDSSMNTQDEDSESVELVANIITICKSYLQDSGAIQQAAALCLARLLSRPDMEDQYLIMFLDFVKYEFDAFCAELISESTPAQARVRQFKISGIMISLSYICEFTPREKHIILMREYFSHAMNVVETIRAHDENTVTSSTLHRKLSTKLLQRMGLLLLPPRVMKWRYSRGLRSLEMNLKMKQNEDSTPEVNDISDEDFDVPEELEQVVDVLLCGLRDRDTVVRWSAAKGIGRITARLPFEFADDIVQSVLELFSSSESDAAWHGASLAVAELSRRCVLLPERLPEAVHAIGLALMYDVRRGAHSIGAHVRDAACYACWSFARAYEPALLLPYLKNTLAPIMLTVCAFDRELNCRRAAAAAFQESVGRQGVGNFPHGIDLLTKADYFTLASISHAYLDVSQHIAKYNEYRYSLIEHVATVKIYHWDSNIRSLASQALGGLAAIDTSYILANVYPQLLVECISPSSDVIVRHGATLALNEITLAIASTPAFIHGEIMKRVKLIPIEMDKRRLYRGRGGEMIRVSVCNLIQIISSIGWSVALTILKKYMTTIEECIRHPSESVRNASIDAFESLAHRYLVKLQDSIEHKLYVEALVPRFLAHVREKNLLNPNVAIRRGFLRALGVTPYSLLKSNMSATIDTMIVAAVSSMHSADEQDAESRVAAIIAMCHFTTKNRGNITEDQISKIVEALLKCSNNDYGVDERGDVGSWVRKESMLSLQKIINLYAIPEKPYREVYDVTVYGFGRGRVVETRRLKKTLVHVQFDKNSLGYSYFAPNGIGILDANRLEISTDRHEKYLPSLQDRLNQTNESQIASCIKIPPRLIAEFCRVLVKQLSEKLDSIRSIAGSTLFDLVHNKSAVDGIPDQPLLKVILKPDINWAMAHDTFPCVARLLDSPEYMNHAVEGLVVSVGGLTESVVKESKTSLLNWLSEKMKQNNLKTASQFAHHCLAMFQKYNKDDRVIIPLMKTIAYCLDERVLTFLHQDGPLFGNALYECVRLEIGKTSDMHKISAGLSVLVGLLPSETTVEQRTLRGLFVCLGHRFPKVRKLTAEKLYTRLILHDELLEESVMNTMLTVLSETAWDAEINDARKRRDSLNELLGFERIEKRITTNPTKKTKTDEGDHSYKALVKEMGF